MISIDQLGDALAFIIKDEDVFEQLKHDFPDILADLVTFKNNPNCTCRGRVVKYFTEQLEKDQMVMNKYVKDLEALKAELNRLQLIKQTNNYSGKIFTIPKTEEAWSNFAMSLHGKMMRSFSVVERENEVVIYIL